MIYYNVFTLLGYFLLTFYKGKKKYQRAQDHIQNDSIYMMYKKVKLIYTIEAR